MGIKGISLWNFKEPAAPSELRWEKADSGTPVSWCYNDTNNPSAFTATQLRDEMAEAVDKVAAACGITFVENAGPPCDIELIWDTGGDGSGGILSFVYQPASGTDMAACGVCGDINHDTAEAWNLNDFHNVVLHELGHSVGLIHTDQTSPNVEFGWNVMDPFYFFGGGLPKFEWGSSDREQLIKRYGKPS